ncbi:hypothetical protein BS47DRAFT_1391967 [Hydnum rufescens UP504]|uniref:WW domain-containing protein n=1 Tax=Hydnum rufescens UP504 TaxID=1448309 RepID=A0A9P6DU73_9AGAM|nr:hypothetical protein BS47DRAFT_1391967 [Hydnum rufescens UP504]
MSRPPSPAEQGASKELAEAGSSSPQPPPSAPTSFDDINRPKEQTPPPAAWQAIWSPAHGAYYFFNPITQETTWTNPLATPATDDGNNGGSSTAPTTATLPEPSSSSVIAGREEPGPDAFGGIDPDLAYLDPSLSFGKSKAQSGPVPTFTAKFNARSGKFAGGDSRDPSHLSEYERAKRMSEAYFDVASWEAQIEEQESARKRAAEDEAAGGGAKKKRLTKADIERFKEQKKEKKMKRTAWLRN